MLRSAIRTRLGRGSRARRDNCSLRCDRTGGHDAVLECAHTQGAYSGELSQAPPSDSERDSDPGRTRLDQASPGLAPRGSAPGSSQSQDHLAVGRALRRTLPTAVYTQIPGAYAQFEVDIDLHDACRQVDWAAFEPRTQCRSPRARSRSLNGTANAHRSENRDEP